jgi:hypothetical protein
MIKAQTFEIMEIIQQFYRFDIDQRKIDSWHNILQAYEFDMVMSNLEKYVKYNQYPPGIADLLDESKGYDGGFVRPVVPSYEETQKYLRKQEEQAAAVANDPKTIEARERARAEIAKILGLSKREVEHGND